MKQNKLGYAHGKLINIYTVYDLKNRTIDNADFTIVNGLLGSVKLTKNTDTSKYQHKGYGICFDSGGTFTSGNINNGRKVIIFVVDTKNSIHSANKNQNIYVLGKDFIQGIDGTTIYAEKFVRLILHNIIKSSYYHCIIMTAILIYLLTEVKNYNLSLLLII